MSVVEWYKSCAHTSFCLTNSYIYEPTQHEQGVGGIGRQNHRDRDGYWHASVGTDSLLVKRHYVLI